MRPRTKDPSLTRIMFIILLLGGIGWGLFRFSQWFNEEYIAGSIEAAAPTTLADAQRRFEEGNTAEARDLLWPVANRLRHDVFTPQALLLLARIDQHTGDTELALNHLKRATYDFPGSAEQPKAAIAYGRLLEEQGNIEEAVAVYEEILRSAPRTLRAPALTGLGRNAEREGSLLAARELYHQAVHEAEWNSESWNEALDALGRTNVELIFSPEPTPESKTYIAQKGDTLTRIGMRLNTTQGLLLRANSITRPETLRVSQQLKYTPKDFRIVIERGALRLFLLDKNGLFKRYSAGLGMKGHETTLGHYKIGSKQKDPTWFRPGMGPVPPGDPRNELGSRWMPMVPAEEDLPTDLGIHGTRKPETVGAYASNGCARLLEEEVQELYDLVVRATPVEVVETFRLEEGQ